MKQSSLTGLDRRGNDVTCVCLCTVSSAIKTSPSVSSRFISSYLASSWFLCPAQTWNSAFILLTPTGSMFYFFFCERRCAKLHLKQKTIDGWPMKMMHHYKVQCWHSNSQQNEWKGNRKKNMFLLNTFPNPSLLWLFFYSIYFLLLVTCTQSSVESYIKPTLSHICSCGKQILMHANKYIHSYMHVLKKNVFQFLLR